MGWAARQNGNGAGSQVGQFGKVLIGWPVGNSEMVCFSASMRALMRYDGMKDEPLLAGTAPAPSIYVDENRNRLVELLLKAPPNVEWLLQIDTDIEFKPQILEYMVTMAEANNFRILGASVPIGESYETSAYLFGDKPGRMWSLTKMPPQPFMVDAVATTCTLIKRDVFTDMAKQYGPCWFTRFSVPDPDSDPEAPIEARKDLVLGEDIAFCYRARAMQIPIWCAHVPGLRHWKLVGFTHDPPEMWPQREKGEIHKVTVDMMAGVT